MVMSSLKKRSGFSLLELLVVLVIVGILASVAYPSYVDSVRKANRSEAIAELQNILAAQERYFLANRTYAKDLTLLGYPAGGTLDNFTLAGEDCDPVDLTLCVEIRASAATDSQKEDGDILMSTSGISALFDHGTDTVKEQL
jgi:type IV pilus assembly protein PilE